MLVEHKDWLAWLGVILAFAMLWVPLMILLAAQRWPAHVDDDPLPPGYHVLMESERAVLFDPFDDQHGAVFGSAREAADFAWRDYGRTLGDAAREEAVLSRAGGAP